MGRGDLNYGLMGALRKVGDLKWAGVEVSSEAWLVIVLSIFLLYLC